MEAVVALLLGIVLFMHAWQLFGLSSPKTTGIVGAAGAVALSALVIQSPIAMMTKVEPAAFANSVVVWAIYAVLVAAVGLWGFEARGLGLYSIFAAAIMIGQVIYCSATVYSLVGIICGIIQAVAFAMLFFHLAIPIQRLRLPTAWVLVVVGVAHGLLGGGLILKISGLA